MFPSTPPKLTIHEMVHYYAKCGGSNGGGNANSNQDTKAFHNEVKPQGWPIIESYNVLPNTFNHQQISQVSYEHCQ